MATAARGRLGGRMEIRLDEAWKSRCEEAASLNGQTPTQWTIASLDDAAERVRATLRGEGLGAALLADAMARLPGIADAVGGKALVVDPANDSARDSHARHGFASIPGADRMFLPLSLSWVGPWI